MDSQATRILLQSILEVQECLHEQYQQGNLDDVAFMWQLQREKAKRLKDGNTNPKPHSPGTPKTNG